MPAAGQEVSELQVAGYTLENRDFTLWDFLHSIVVKKVVIPARGYVNIASVRDTSWLVPVTK